MRRLILLAFGAIQLVLLARLLIDLDVLPSRGDLAEFVVPLSETLAAPVQALADAIGVDFGGVAGGADAAVIGALIGWSLLEGIALMLAARSG